MNKLNKIFFKKLLVVSKKEQKAKEIQLDNKLNLIIGGNKTGKSSLIKSLFHTLGCKVKFEKSWIELISYYYIELFCNDNLYSFIRIENTYYIKEYNEIDFHVFEEYTEFIKYFNKIFNINLKVTNKQGGSTPPSPALLFSFQYIDQDIGWGAIPTKFSNIGYYNKGYDMSIRYITDCFTNEYFTKNEERDNLKAEIDIQKNKIHSIDKFLNEVYEQLDVTENNINPFKYTQKKVSSLLKDINKIEEYILLLNRELVTVQNNINENHKNLAMIEKANVELMEDINFSNQLSEELICPFCLTTHSNDLNNIFNLISDKNELDKIKNSLRASNKSSLQEKDTILSEIRKTEKTKINLQKKVDNIEENHSIINSYKQQGINDMIKVNRLIADKEKSSLFTLNSKFDSVAKRITELSSRKITNKITSKMKEHFHLFAKELNLKDTKPNFRVFRPSLSNYTGSELARAIYAFYLSLYKYNTKKSSYPFKFLVVDTPNQQGQDDDNLSSIYALLPDIRDLDGQFILASEQLTGYEEQANTILLVEERNLLNNTDYLNNRFLIEKIDKIIN